MAPEVRQVPGAGRFGFLLARAGDGFHFYSTWNLNELRNFWKEATIVLELPV
jgi:hypothetical protein